MSARDDYPFIIGQEIEQRADMCDEIDRLRANLDEANSEWADAIAQRDTARHDLATIREALQ